MVGTNKYTFESYLSKFEAIFEILGVKRQALTSKTEKYSAF